MGDVVEKGESVLLLLSIVESCKRNGDAKDCFLQGSKGNVLV